MTTTDIRQKVKEGADAHFGDTVDKLLLLLRRQHTHQSHKKECFCDYCQFIRKEYTDSKISFHRAKRRMEFYDGLYFIDEEEQFASSGIDSLTRFLYREKLVLEMKRKKFDMWKNVL